MQNGPSKNPQKPFQLEEAKKHTDSIKIERISLLAPFNLSEELWLQILSYLSPQVILLLKKTDVFFHRLASDATLWKMHIASYFPYLEATHAQEYAKNPYKLFFDEVLRHLEVAVIKSIPLRFQLLALKGSLATIDASTLSEQEKKVLYIYAASNSHLTALAKLEPKEKVQAFIRACEKGYLVAAQSLYEQCTADITNGNKGRALQLAIRHGQLSVVTWLLVFANQITDYEKSVCTQEAAKNNQLVIFQRLLSLMPDVVPLNKESCFSIAGQHNAFSVATFLLKQFGAGCLNEWTPKYEILINATKAGENLLVKLLLNHWLPIDAPHPQEATEIAVETDNMPLIKHLCSRYQFITAFHAASKKGKLAIVQWVFKHYGAQINAKNKGNALCAAIGGHHFEIITWLLEECGTASFKRRLPMGLKWLSALDSSSWMQWFFHKTAGTLSREAKREALIVAAKEGDVSTLQCLLNHLEDDLPSQHKCDALKASAEAGNLETIRYLLEQCSPAYFATSLRRNMLWSFLEHLTLLPENFLESRAIKMSAKLKETVLQLAADNHHYKIVIWLIAQYKKELSHDAKIKTLKSIIYPHDAPISELLDIIDAELSDTPRRKLLAQTANFNQPTTIQRLRERWNSKISTHYKEALKDSNAVALLLGHCAMYCDKELFDVAKTYTPLQAVSVSNAVEDTSPNPETNESYLRATLS